MSIVKNLFGGSQKSSSTSTTSAGTPFITGLNLTTPGSSLTSRLKGKNVTSGIKLNPLVQLLRDEAISGIRGLQGDVPTLSNFTDRLISARVDPLRERFAPVLGRLQRDLGRRNVQGSIANNEMLRAESDIARTLAQEEAAAFAEGEQAQFGADLNTLNARRALTSDIERLSQEQLSQELALLGLGQGPSGMIASSIPTTTTQTTKQPNSGSGLGNLLFGVGSFFG